MARKLPSKLSAKNKIILEAVKDFYGPGASAELKRNISPVALWIMNRRKGNKLSDEQKEDVESIRLNLADLTYRGNLQNTP